MEEHVVIDAGGLELEGLFAGGAKSKAVVVTHPHPLYGGDMSSPVVEAVAMAYGRCGWATLRFNFRGTGKSQGAFDNGRGEAEDVLAALTFLEKRGFETVDLAGYSFGAWINALACRQVPVPGRMVMVAPPVNFLDFGTVADLKALELVIAGDRDDFGALERVRTMVATWNPAARLEVIAGADHFFWSDLDRIEAIVRDFLHTSQ